MTTPADHTSLYRLIRDYMGAMGTSRTTLVALKSYIDSIRRLRCTEAELQRSLLELDEVIRNTEPRVIPLVHLIREFEAEMRPHFGSGLEHAKAEATRILGRKLERFHEVTGRLIAHCVSEIADGDFIVIHSPTAYIREALVRAHTVFGRRFRVLVLKQESRRAKAAVEALERHGVEHLVIPDQYLSHYLDVVTKFFLGAVSVSSDRKAIIHAGAANMVGLCHAHRIPVYLFLEKIKFAHTALSNQHIYREHRARVEADFTFHMTTFSHDFVDLEMIRHVVTEDGEETLSP
jgi:translation initiation factor eIF-2B subunit alpha